MLQPCRVKETLGGRTYQIVSINNRKVMVHRMVAAAFLGEIPSGRIVHHRDCNKTNNRPENLEIATYSQNTRYAYTDGRIGSHYKLNPFQRRKVVELYQTGKYHARDLAKQFDVGRDTIGFVLNAAGIKLNWRKKLTPAQYEEIRAKWIPYEYSMSQLAKDYNVSVGMIEAIVGVRSMRKGVKLTHAKISTKI